VLFRSWGPQYPGGARIWRDAQNLVELNLESPAVRDFLWNKPDSVVQSYLAQGVDGWRLDVGYDIGFAYLGELTRAAHGRKPGSRVLGEIANYPREWFPSVGGGMGTGGAFSRSCRLQPTKPALSTGMALGSMRRTSRPSAALPELERRCRQPKKGGRN